MIRNFLLTICIALVALFLLGPTVYAKDLKSEAGFVEVKPIDYTLADNGKKSSGGRNYTTITHNIFYSFFPADKEATSKPLFVMLNGGPGAATATNLFSMNTAPYTLDRERQGDGNNSGYAKNKYSWTSLGNLLYIDAPATGFSYMVASWARNPISRTKMILRGGNFNPEIDAAQIIRVILRFLKAHKEIQANEVILVGESYGGTRVSAMLNMLLFSSHYGKHGDRVYRDPALVEEITTHFKEALLIADNQGTESAPSGKITPEDAAKQFGKQILIQPSLSGPYQDEVQGTMFYDKAPYRDKVVKDMAQKAGKKFPLKHDDEIEGSRKFCSFGLAPIGSPSNCVLMWYLPEQFNLDRYNALKPDGWSDDLEAFAVRSLRNYDVLKVILQYDPAKIKKMYANKRNHAFKLIGKQKEQYMEGVKDTTKEDSVGRLLGVEDNSDEYKDLLKLKTLSPKYFAAVEKRKNVALKVESFEKLPGKSLQDQFGKLWGWDEYMEPMNDMVYIAFLVCNGVMVYPLNADITPRYGEMFLENAQLVNTFLTDALYDMVIYSPAIPEAFKKYTSIVDNVSCTRGTGNELGTFEIKYNDGVFTDLKEQKKSVKLYYPHYAESGHSVSSAQPGKLLKDVGAWLGK